MIDYRSPWMDDELEMFRDAARRFVENEIVPNDARWREQHHVDRELWSRAGEVGLLCTDIPAEYGGVGGDARHEAVVTEEMGRRGITSFGHTVHSILAHYVLNYGSDAQRKNWLPRMASGELGVGHADRQRHGRHGQAGDQVVRQVGAAILQECRQSGRDARQPAERSRTVQCTILCRRPVDAQS